MNYKILLLALVAFSFLLAGCGGKKGEAAPAEGAPAEEPGAASAEEPAEEPEAQDEDKEKLANLFDIEIDEPPDDFTYDKAPGEG